MYQVSIRLATESRRNRAAGQTVASRRPPVGMLDDRPFPNSFGACPVWYSFGLRDSSTLPGMPQPSPLAMTKRLERVRAVAADLSRLLDRASGHSLGTRAMADQIRNDADAVLRLLNRQRPVRPRGEPFRNTSRRHTARRSTFCPSTSQRGPTDRSRSRPRLVRRVAR